jgi:hypothetical protein
MRKFAGVFIVFLCCATAMAADFTGTWKLNLQKTKMRSANITAETLTIEKTGPNSYRTTIDRTLTSGEKYHVAIDRVYDGKERAVSGPDAGSPHSEICEVVTGGGRKIQLKADGKVTTINSTLSADGQTLTNLRSDAEGEDVLIYDREK